MELLNVDQELMRKQNNVNRVVKTQPCESQVDLNLYSKNINTQNTLGVLKQHNNQQVTSSIYNGLQEQLEDLTMQNQNNRKQERFQKQFSPQEYFHYAQKVKHCKENLIGLLQSLGYNNLDQLDKRPIQEVINKTNNIMQNTYSIKYVGVVNGDMGILSKRIKLTKPPKEKNYLSPIQQEPYDTTFKYDNNNIRQTIQEQNTTQQKWHRKMPPLNPFRTISNCKSQLPNYLKNFYRSSQRQNNKSATFHGSMQKTCLNFNQRGESNQGSSVVMSSSDNEKLSVVGCNKNLSVKQYRSKSMRKENNVQSQIIDIEQILNKDQSDVVKDTLIQNSNKQFLNIKHRYIKRELMKQKSNIFSSQTAITEMLEQAKTINNEKVLNRLKSSYSQLEFQEKKRQRKSEVLKTTQD